MAKKAAVKKSKKEMQADKNRRLLLIILAVFFVLVMVIVPLAYIFNPTSINTRNNTRTVTFDSIVDAASLIPPDAQYVRYVDLSAGSDILDATMDNIGSNLPNATMLGASPVKDAIASYPFPTLGYITEDPQAFVLSDMGSGFDNASYTQTTINNVPMRIVKDPYAFSVGTYPVVSGRKEYVAAIVNYMSTITRANSAYASYFDLFDQVSADNQSASRAKFAVAGVSDTLGIGDRYYAGITPLNATTYDYRIVIHLNQTLNETQQLAFAQRWELGAELYGLEPLTPQFKDNYLLLAAKGSAADCLSDMVNWDFLKG